MISFCFIFNIATLKSQTISINKVVSSNTIHPNKNGDTPDWFKIHNASNQEISLHNTSSYIVNKNTIPFTDSNLPIVIITTDYLNEILDDPRVFGHMQIIERPNGSRNFVSDANNEEYLNYSGTISIEIRGSSSQLLDKKPYGFTTLSDDKLENDNVALLGMPKENDWILNSFAFDDSMMRDFISYEMARKMGQYAVNLKYCEVIINGDYKGLYALSEKIKIDGDRVDIKKLSKNDNSLPDITGGYLIQTDRPSDKDPEVWYNNGAGYIIERPKPEDITVAQSSYIETVFRNFDQNAANPNIINGYPSLIDVPSFIDYMLIAEIASNVDAYALSTFYHKDRGGKLRAGPVWDYNLTFGNDLFHWDYDRSFTDVWQFKYSNVGANFWSNLFDDKTFQCYMSKRFNEVTQTGAPLNYQYISNLIDDTVDLIGEAVVRENQRWASIENFNEEITQMKSWITQRIQWMKSNLGSFSNCNSVQIPSLVITKIDYNPKEDETFTKSDDLEFIEIKNTGNTSVDLTGIYLLKLGVSYQFSANSTITAGESIILASDATTFQNKYGVAPFDSFIRNLSNKNQNLVLSDAFGNIIDEVEYFDKEPWPQAADGDGFYLELINEKSDNSLASSWKASTNPILNTNKFHKNEPFLKIYPNPVSNILFINSKDLIQEFTIYNLLGQKIKTIKANFKIGEIDLKKVKKGAYFLTIKLKKGTRFSRTFFKN